jgi:hypothetical protein
VVPPPSFRLRHGVVPFVAIALEHVDLLQAIFPVDVNSRNKLNACLKIATSLYMEVTEEKAEE